MVGHCSFGFIAQFLVVCDVKSFNYSVVEKEIDEVVVDELVEN